MVIKIAAAAAVSSSVVVCPGLGSEHWIVSVSRGAAWSAGN